MSLTGGNSITWSIVVILVIPAAIIAAAELDERLRQHQSKLRPAVLTLRGWALPLFAIWALLVPVMGFDDDDIVARLALSGLIISLVAAGLSVLRVIIGGVRDRPRSDGRRPVPQLLLALPRLAVIIVAGWILIDGVWGVDLSAALTALGVTSLIISFALQDTLSGLASGMLLLSDPPFKPGDWIRSSDIEGMVIDVNWRTSRIQNRDGDIIIVTNGELASASIVNFSAPEKLHRVVVSLQVAYVNAPTLAKDMLLDAAKSTPGVLSDPAPRVMVTQIDDPLMGYDVQMWVSDYAIAPKVKSDFGALVWYQSHRHGVPLPSPAQDLYLYDGVAIGEAGTPTAGELGQSLLRSPLLTALADDELDRLAKAARAVRYRAGEIIVDSRNSSRDLFVVIEGQARLLVLEAGQGEHEVGEIGHGEILGLVGGSSREGLEVVARAVTDCEVIVIEADAAAEVASRNAELAAALNRVASVRRRRIERATDRPLGGVRTEPEVPSS